VVAYRGGWLEAQIARRLITAETAVLANLVLGEKVVPEFLQEYGTVPAVSEALCKVIADTPERARQTEAFARLDAVMGFAGDDPSVKAARVVLDTWQARRKA
jgi:lipid-A-disaccharide synthase